MGIETAIVNGSENYLEIEDDKVQALVLFYKAFNERNMSLMRNVWLNSDDASMNNPVGGIVRNWENIASIYDKIFNGKANVYVEFYDFTFHATDNMFLITGRERGHFEKGKMKIELAIRTSRVFIKNNGEWKQIQHHGSIDDPDLLKKYQEAILNK